MDFGNFGIGLVLGGSIYAIMSGIGASYELQRGTLVKRDYPNIIVTASGVLVGTIGIAIAVILAVMESCCS